jgi:hypothetical protein
MHPAKVPSVLITFKRRSFCADSRDITWALRGRRGREAVRERDAGQRREKEIGVKVSE